MVDGTSLVVSLQYLLGPHAMSSSQQIIHSRHPPVKRGPQPGDNLATFLESNPNNAPSSKPAFIRAHDGKPLSRGQLFDESHRLAWSLVNKLSLQQGSRVGILSHNSLYYPVAIHAHLLAGVTSVTLNPAYSVEELVHPLKDCKPEYVFAAPALLPTIKEALSKAGLPEIHPRSGLSTIWALDDADDWKEKKAKKDADGVDDLRSLIDASQGQKLQAVKVDDPTQRDAFICYSSGTSGKPKGVQLPQ